MGLFKQELQAIWKNKMTLISIIAILFIPIMYSGMLIWSFWDPYNSLEHLPVAIVNNDTGAELNGKKIEIGQELVDNLKEGKELDYQFVDSKTGYEKLNNQEVYLLVEIPKNFSKNASTLLDEAPKKLELKYVANEGANFLSSQIGGSAIKEMKNALSNKVTETYAETVFDTMSEMADGYQSTDEAAGDLKDGIVKLDDGTKTLKEHLVLLAKKQLEFSDGTTKLQEGTAELQKGTATLSSGLNQLSAAQSHLVLGAEQVEAGGASLQSGIQQTKDGMRTVQGKMNEIITGTEQIQQGSTQLSSSLQKLETGANSAADGASQLATGVGALSSQLEPVMSSLPKEQQAVLKQALAQVSTGATKLEGGNKELAASISQIETGATTLSDKMTTLNDGQKALQAGIAQVYGGTEKLASGATTLQDGQSQLRAGLVAFDEKLTDAAAGGQKLADGSTTLVDSMNLLQNGSTALADGSNQLAKGSDQLVTGTEKLAKGSTEFKDKIHQAAKDSANLDADQDTYDMVADPVSLDKQDINVVSNYGTGIAPYFISLGLFVGALLLTIVFPFRAPAGIPKNGLSWFVGKWLILTIVSILQSLIVDFIVLQILDMQVQSVSLFVVFTIITSLSFMMLIQLLVTTMENPGRFIGLIILILQLSSSAGTFPLELIPERLQVFNRYLPMTYSISGFKDVISVGNYSDTWQNGYILIGFTIGSMLLTLLYFILKHKKSYSGVSKPAVENNEEI